jgi:UDP-glucuronate 4-epimerase
MAYLVTGCAGFIGHHVAKRLLDADEEVVGIDNLNPYYDVELKRARLDVLLRCSGFRFHQLDITDFDAMTGLMEHHRVFDGITHLAAQAGVRYSLSDPLSYVDANVKGQVTLLEAMRRLKNPCSIIYASSSSVYGARGAQPSRVEDRADDPASLYAATKRAAELVTASYCHLYKLSATGLRFFTVYGPWGRPDMAYWLFTEAIIAGRPIKVFNEGRMTRDFTYIDDVVQAIIAALHQPPRPGHRLYNVGNHKPEPLLEFIAELERAVGQAAVKEMLPMQAGDVVSTYADIEPARRDLGFEPTTPISEGLPRFVAWYRDYHGLT